MNLKQFAVTAMTAGTLVTATLSTSACSAEESIQAKLDRGVKNKDYAEEFVITKNPNAKQAYKLKVKIKDAPRTGFKYNEASVTFDVANIKECGFIVEATQEITSTFWREIAFPLTQLSDTEYEGTFYTDWGQDGDFFNNGVCHWQFRNVGASFSATGADGETRFGNGMTISEYGDSTFAVNQPLTTFYLKQRYPRSNMDNYPDGGVGDPADFKPEQLFSITVTVEEIQ
jgi:ferredoxin-like protein FixX